MTARPAALTLRWSLRDGTLPETCDGVVRVVQLTDEHGPFFAAVGEGLPWRGTSRVSPEMAARDWLQQTARGIDAEVMLTDADAARRRDRARRAVHPRPGAADIRGRHGADAHVGSAPVVTARPFALVRAHAATLDGPLGDDLRALLAAWDAEHPGAVGERYLASVGGSVWTAAEERGDDFVLRGERGEAWEVSRDFLAAEVRAGRMRRE